MLHLPDIAGLSSTVVETVSLDVNDFSDSFLTCGTCLQLYDAASRRPKLLPCSHSLCLECAHLTADGTSRCPLCGAVFVVPQAGPAALPPSFVVNQLLDLMSSASRRDVVPRCARHVGCELLFCETCDVVFCADCDDVNDGAPSHNALSAGLSSSSAAHNVVPFAIAIRRVTEIMQYKATQCTSNLDAAAAAVNAELRRVDAEAERCVDAINCAYAELNVAVEQRERAIAHSVHSLCHDKTRVLHEQLALIAAERECVRTECEGLPADIRAITGRIGKLNELLDAASFFLAEPRENAYIEFADSGCAQLHEAISKFGAVRTSETLPALCTLELTQSRVSVHVVSRARLVTYASTGRRQTVGGDPVSVELLDSRRCPVPVMILDVGDGTYELMFTAVTAGIHSLTVHVFDRVVGSSCPLSFSVDRYHWPVSTYSALNQPVAVAVDGDALYVLDTGNSRVAVYDTSLTTSAARYIVNESLTQRSATGLTLRRSLMYVINWRTCRVSWFRAADGLDLHSFDCDEFIEPTSLTVANDSTIFVADNGVHRMFVFAPCGKLLRKIELTVTGGSKSDLVTCIYATSAHDEILVCDHRVRALSYDGEFLYELTAGDSHGHGQYGGVVVDGSGRYLASRSERGRAMIQVFGCDRQWCFSIECEGVARLRRPSGLAVDDRGRVFVADLASNCVRQFRYT